MVSTKSATVVTELPKDATTLLPGCERKSLTTWWRCIGDLLQHCHSSWRLTGNLFKMLVTTATLGDFFKQFKKVAKRLCGSATIDDGRQCTGNVLAKYWRSLTIRAMWWQFPRNHRLPPRCQHFASTFSDSVKGADRLATGR